MVQKIVNVMMAATEIAVLAAGTACLLAAANFIL